MLIANNIEHEHVEEALKLFISMSCEGLSPDVATFVHVYGLAWNVSMEIDYFPLLWST